MGKLVITRGLPASGKSTKALAWVAEDEKNRARVNRDELRMALYGRYWPVEEDVVTVAQKAAVTALLRAGKSVVVDDTNLRLRVARGWADLAVQEGVEFEVWDVTTDVEEAVQRDYLRGSKEFGEGGRRVGEDVINDFAQRYPMPWPEVKPTARKADDPPAKYVPVPGKPGAIIVDLDGTLAHNVTGRPFFGKGFEKRVHEDRVDPNVAEAAFNFLEAGGRHIIFMSGRDEIAREQTERWILNKARFLPDQCSLFMRPEGDTRPDYIVKAELFDKHVRHEFNVLLALDDRDQVVNLWRGMGIPCWQVKDGAY